MDNIFHIDPSLKIPIYQQLVDEIRSAVKSGRLPSGTRLPTVRELACSLDVAAGTVKNAYDKLYQEGLIKMIQGRGTFVSFKPTGDQSRKDRAMEAIDNALAQMENMGFSLSEINIFLNLKLRELESHRSNLSVTLVECAPEVLSQLGEDLRQIERIDLHSALVDDIIAYPYKLADDTDLVITTAGHAEELQAFVPTRRNIAKIALRLSSRTIKQIIKLPPNEKVGILCADRRFGNLVFKSCMNYNERIAPDKPCLFSENIQSYVKDKSALLLPENYETYCSADELNKTEHFTRGKKLILCRYHIDEGSFMYLEEKIHRLIEEKKI